MSREIKFRAWNKEEEKMLSNVAVQNGKQVWAEQAVGSDVWDAKLVAGNNIIMQFTGLKDKNGKEIYEGDVVKSRDNNLFIINYEYGSFGASWIKDDLVWYSSATKSFYQKIFEVIGNIYENPEFLKEGE